MQLLSLRVLIIWVKRDFKQNDSERSEWQELLGSQLAFSSNLSFSVLFLTFCPSLHDTLYLSDTFSASPALLFTINTASRRLKHTRVLCVLKTFPNGSITVCVNFSNVSESGGRPSWRSLALNGYSPVNSPLQRASAFRGSQRRKASSDSYQYPPPSFSSSHAHTHNQCASPTVSLIRTGC